MNQEGGMEEEKWVIGAAIDDADSGDSDRVA